MRTPSIAALREARAAGNTLLLGAEAMAEVEALAREISGWVNRHADNHTGWALAFEITVGEHRTLQQSLMRHLIIPVLDLLAQEADEGFHDARNEATVNLARLIRDRVSDEVGWPPPLPFI